MKNISLILWVLISIDSFAQVSIGSAAYFGKSEFQNDIESNGSSVNYTEARNSFAVGVFGEYQFSKWFSMQADLLYDQLNSEKFYIENKINPTGYQTNQSDKLTYLSLPLSMQFNIKRFHLNIGCQPSFLLYNYYKSTIIDQNQNRISSEGNREVAFKRLNVSFLAGISYRVYKNIYIECRYTKGVTDITNNTPGNYSNEKTKQFLVGLYYQAVKNDKKKIVEFPEIVSAEKDVLKSENPEEALISNEKPKAVGSISAVEIDSNLKDTTLVFKIIRNDSTVSEIGVIEKKVELIDSNDLAIVENQKNEKEFEAVSNKIVEVKDSVIIEKKPNVVPNEIVEEKNPLIVTTKVEEFSDKTVEVKDSTILEKEALITQMITDREGSYVIQILALSKFSQVRLDAYCKKHKLPKEQVSTRIVNGITKVIYGKAKTLNETNRMITNLKLNNNIDAAFAVPYTIY